MRRRVAPRAGPRSTWHSGQLSRGVVEGRSDDEVRVMGSLYPARGQAHPAARGVCTVHRTSTQSRVRCTAFCQPA